MRCATQGLRARGLSLPPWTRGILRIGRVETNAIARLPLPLILPSIGDHLGAARSVAWHRAEVMRSGWLSSWIFATQTQ